MQNLKNLLTKPLRPIPTSIVIFVLLVALVGFADSTYLTIEHFQGVIPPCKVVEGCDTVLTSPYSEVFGIPVALGGSIFYLLVTIGAFAYLESKNEKMLRLALLITVFGILASLWFLILQAFVLKAYCTYCLLSIITSTTLFITACIVFNKYGEKGQIK
jgi:uncharacterized membrane protein